MCRYPEVGDVWLVSASTVSLIPILHSDIRSNPVEKYLPEWMLRESAFDTALWQWFALLLSDTPCASVRARPGPRAHTISTSSHPANANGT